MNPPSSAPPITGKTRVVLLLGDPVDHIVGTAVHNEFYASLGQDVVCVPLHVSPDRLSEMTRAIRDMRNVIGCGVTIPHKVPMLDLVDHRLPMAERVGAVNFIRRGPDGTLFGDNIDGSGFVSGVLDSGVVLKGRRALQLGAGGAGRAIAFGLADAGVSELVVWNRSTDKALALVDAVRHAHPGLTTAVMSTGPTADPSGFDFIVNTTSTGMIGITPLPMDLFLLTTDMIVAEVVMTPTMTPLVLAAAALGCQIVPGRKMLDGQMEQVKRLLEF